MMASGRLLQWFVVRLPGVSMELRGELSDAVSDHAADGSRWDHAAELASLAGLSLTLMARHGTADDRWESTRQGVRLGALAAAIGLVATSAAAGNHLLALAFGALVIALGSGASVAPRLLVAVIAAVAVISDAVVPAGVLVAMAVGVVVGSPHDRRRCVNGALSAAAAVGLAIAVPALWPERIEVFLIAATVVAVVAMTAAGWFDPRFAIGAAFLGVARFVETGAGVFDLETILALEVTDPQLRLIRLSLMGAGIVISVVIAGCSLRRQIGGLGNSPGRVT